MAGDFSAEEKAYMIDHMNDDHGDACLLYATHYLGLTEAQSATMTDVTHTAMTLDVQLGDGSIETVDYAFERPLTSVRDAAMFMAEMVYRLQED